MSNNKQQVFEAFWKAMDKPAGYTKKSGFLKAGVRDTVVKGENGVCYLLWGHNIAEFANGILTLCDCGYQTVTTKDRLNAILRENKKLDGFYVEQNKGIWYLTYQVWKDGKFTQYRRFKWHSGAKINLAKPFENLIEITPEALQKKVKDYAKRVSSFLNEMKSRIDNDGLASGGGECWGITMGMQECHECEYLARTNCGGGIRLIEKALAEKGYRHPALFFCKFDDKGAGKPDKVVMQEHWEHYIKPALRTYIKKRLAKSEYNKVKPVEDDGMIRGKKATFKENGEVVVEDIAFDPKQG